MPRTAGTWTETFHVRAYEVDPRGRVAIQTLCNYFQEAAGNHAETYGVSVADLLDQGLTWVLARLHVQMDRYPRMGSTIRIETWPSGIEGLLATRDFRFFEVQNDTVEEIGRGTSGWIVIDAAGKRPVRVPAVITEIQLPDLPPTIPNAFSKFDVPDYADHQCRYGVRYSDLDINQHVNNVRYAEWAVGSVPDDILHTHQIHRLELQFKAETTFGDAVVARATRQNVPDGATFTHRLLRESDARDVALARTHWRPATD